MAELQEARKMREKESERKAMEGETSTALPEKNICITYKVQTEEDISV